MLILVYVFTNEMAAIFATLHKKNILISYLKHEGFL
jgi:hypothetical protein